jgi:hypothetical protein
MKTTTIDLEHVASVITKAISEIQALSGRDPSVGGPNVTPIGDLDGFDSYCSIEATVLIGVRLEITFELESIFISDDGQKALTIGEIAERVRDIMITNGGSDEQIG